MIFVAVLSVFLGRVRKKGGSRGRRSMIFEAAPWAVSGGGIVEAAFEVVPSVFFGGRMEEGARHEGRASLLMLVPPYPFEHHHWPRAAAGFAVVVVVAADLLDVRSVAAVAAAEIDGNAAADCTAKA